MLTSGILESIESTSDSEQIWKKVSLKIVKKPSGQLTAADWNEAINAIRYWRQNNEGVFADDMRWSLLDRLVEEEKVRQLDQLSTHDFALVILAWVEQQQHSANSPLTILQKLFHYQELVPYLDIDVKAYSMVLNASIQSDSGAVLADLMMERINNGKIFLSRTRLDTVLFTTIISIYATSGLVDAPQRAEAVLDTMRTLYAKGMDTAPSDKTYMCLMAAWANSGDPKAPEIVEKLMVQYIAEPDTTAFSIVMNAWAKSTDHMACAKCLSIFKHMNMLYEQGRIRSEPNMYIYGCVIQSFGRRGRAREAEAVLQQLLDRYEATKNPELCPSTVVFNSLIDGWARSNERDGPQRAEAVLEKMQRLAVATGNESIKPDTVSFTCVLNAWSKDPNGAQRAEAILNRMKQLHKAGNSHVKPSAATLTSVLNCWAKSEMRGAAERAEQMLMELNKHYDETGEAEYKPSHHSYTCVMDAWARSGNKQAPERVQALIEDMEIRGLELAPHQYATAIIAWARSGRPDSVSRAEALLQRMTINSEKLERPDLAPDVTVFNALLDAYARNKRAPKAQETLNRMLAGFQQGNEHLKPNTISINTVISAWSNSGDPNAGIKAEECFQRMEEHGAELDFSADQRTFSSLISAFAKSAGSTSPNRAQHYFDEMKRRYEAGDVRCKPNVVTYSALLNAWSNSRERSALNRGYAILDEMKERVAAGDQSVSPNSFTYLPIIKLISNSDMQHKAIAAWDLLKEMDERHIETSIVVFNKIIWTCVKARPEEANEAFEVATNVFRRIHKSVDITPTYHTYTFYFKLLTPNHEMEREEAVRLCRLKGFHTHERVVTALDKMLTQNGLAVPIESL